MEALVPAFVAAFFAQIGDRSPWLTAILSDRFGKPFTVAAAALIAHGAGNAIAGTGALLIAPMLTPEARQLLIALALAFAALSGFARLRAPERLDSWRLGAFVTTLLGVFILAIGDTTQFFTFAFAARGGSPWFAVAGATAGAFTVNLAAALLGERAWRRLPVRALRLAFAALALAGGAWLAADALRLI